MALPRLATLDNFRDIAGPTPGYPTAGGALTAAALYRANRVEVSADDLAYLQGLGLTAIHDLRMPDEIERHPDAAIPGAKWQHHPVPGIPGDQVWSLTDAEQMYEAMLENYRTFVSDPACRAGFGSLLRSIAKMPGPQLFHCSAGKDRTGWAAILLQHIAGASHKSMVTDYLLTDEYAVSSRQATLDSILTNLGPERVPAYEPAFRCDTNYLDVAFAEVARLYGDLDGYLADGLGVEDAAIAQLREKLTPADAGLHSLTEIPS